MLVLIILLIRSYIKTWPKRMFIYVLKRIRLFFVWKYLGNFNIPNEDFFALSYLFIFQ
jgi:hypothetical protein